MSAFPSVPDPIRIGNVDVHPVSLTDTLHFVESVIRCGRRARVFYLNAHAVNLAARDPDFRRDLLGADLVFCDGMAVKWATHLLGNPLPDRLTPPDWIDELAELAVANGYRVFFLGARPGVADAAADSLRLAHPGLSVSALHGFYSKGGPENEYVLEQINAFQPHVLLVGFGMPLQERWITDNLPSLDVNVALSVGALFDSMAGAIDRGPSWLTGSGFEWLTRLAREPRRLGRRYLVGNPQFIGIVLVQLARQRKTR